MYEDDDDRENERRRVARDRRNGGVKNETEMNEMVSPSLRLSLAEEESERPTVCCQ